METKNFITDNGPENIDTSVSNTDYVMGEMLQGTMAGLAVMKCCYDAYGEIVDFSFKAMNHISRQITGVYSEDTRHNTLLSVYPGPEGHHFLEKFASAIRYQRSAHFGTVMGKDGNIWSLAGMAHHDELTLTFINLSDSVLVREVVEQTVVTIEVQKAVRDKNNQIIDFEMMYVSDVAGNRHPASKYALGKKLLQMLPPEIVRSCFTDFVEVMDQDNCIKLKEYYGDTGLKTCVRNSVVKFNDSVMITFIDMSAKVVHDFSKDPAMLLMRANKELDQLTKVVAHDLQEPLRKITLFQSLLEKTFDSPVQRKYSLLIDRSIQLMQIKLDDLLLYLQIQSNLKLTLVNMNHVLRDVLLGISDSINMPAPSITVHSLPEMIADYNMMFILFQSLLGNAIGFNNSEHRTVIVNCQVKDSEHLFCVQDNGIGIDKKYEKKIFEIFQKLESGEYSTGIGLPVCKKIAELHGGRIWFESVMGHGSTFYISIPKLRQAGIEVDKKH